MLAIRRREIVLERDAITSAVITDDPWVWLRGVRSPGAHVPGKLACGTWRGSSGRDFALIRSGRPAVVIDLDAVDDGESGKGSEFDQFARVILSTCHAAELVSALRLEESGEASEAVFSTED
jgi:hypothetical protein